MDNEVTLKSAAEKFSKQIEELEKQRDEIMNKLSELTYKRDILIKAEEVLTETETPDSEETTPVIVRMHSPLRRGSPVQKDGKGMTASAIKILSPGGKFMSVREVVLALQQEGYKTRRVNVYVMLKRLVESGKVLSKNEEGLLKYGLKEDNTKKELLY